MARPGNAEQVPDDEIERRQRIVDWIGAALAAVGVVGILLDRSLLVLWVFLIAFGVAKLPKAIYDRIRARSR